jgi:hypothetical protein
MTKSEKYALLFSTLKTMPADATVLRLNDGSEFNAADLLTLIKTATGQASLVVDDHGDDVEEL